MQAVILAAGQSNRFYPFTNVSHKSLTVIMGKTLIEHTILAIKRSGIKDIIVVTGKENHVEMVIGNGKNIGVNIKYVIQPEPLGMGDALLRAKHLIKSDFFLTNANHVEFHEFAPQMIKKSRKKNDIVLLGRKEESTGVYGCMVVEGDKVTGFIEKPSEFLQSSLRHIGIYLFSEMFLEILEKTPLEHYHLERAIDTYAHQGNVRYIETNKETLTLKYAWDLLGIKDYLLKNIQKHISRRAEVSEYAMIIGNVFIEDGAKILEGACIKGPCYIGKNTYVGNNALLRNGVCLEEGAIAGSNAELKNCLIMQNSHTHFGFIGDSVIGRDCRIGGGFCTANQRLDRTNVSLEIKSKKINSSRKYLGVLMGDNVKIGAHVVTMPGVIIGNNSFIGPSTTVMKNVPDNAKYYTKFEQILKEKLQ